MKIVPTDKELTRKAVFDTLGDEILRCSRDRWLEFDNAADTQGLEPDDKIYFNSPEFWLDKWLSTRPWAVDWLIEHGFAREKKKPFEPFDLRIKTEEAMAWVWHRFNMNGKVFIDAYRQHHPSEPKIFGFDGKEFMNGSGLWRQVNNKIKEMGGQS